MNKVSPLFLLTAYGFSAAYNSALLKNEIVAEICLVVAYILKAKLWGGIAPKATKHLMEMRRHMHK